MPFNYQSPNPTFTAVGTDLIQAGNRNPFQIAGEAMTGLNDVIDNRNFRKSLEGAKGLEDISGMVARTPEQMKMQQQKQNMFQALENQKLRDRQMQSMDISDAINQQNLAKQTFDLTNQQQALNLLQDGGTYNPDEFTLDPRDIQAMELAKATGETLDPEFMPSGVRQSPTGFKKASLTDIINAERILGKTGTFDIMQLQSDAINSRNKASSTGKATWEVLPPDRVEGLNLDPTKSWQISSLGEIKEKGATGASITKQTEMKEGLAKESARHVVTAIDKAYDLYASHAKKGNWDSVTGLTGAAMSYLPTSDRTAVEGYLTTIKANIGFDKLQSMRDASPTGGALGQVSELELVQLNNSIASVDLSQPSHVIMDNLNVIRDQYNTIIHGEDWVAKDNAKRMKKQSINKSGTYTQNGKTYLDTSSFNKK